MKKSVIAVIAAQAAAAVFFTACGSQAKPAETTKAAETTAAVETTAAAETTAAPETTAAETAAAETTAAETAEAAQAAPASLPEFVYTDGSPYLNPILDYMKENYAKHYDPADVLIPAFDLLREDESNPEDIKVWGRFWINNYSLRGTTLMHRNGGAYDGCAHLKKTDGGYEVTSIDMVQDGSDSGPSTERIFGIDKELMEGYRASDADFNDCMASAVHMYSENTGVEIKAWSDYGWDPVPLPDAGEFVISYPDLKGEWKAENGTETMTVKNPEDGNIYETSVKTVKDGKDVEYKFYGQYEQSTNSLYYWDGWMISGENEDEFPGGGIFKITEEGNLHWTADDGTDTVFVRQ